MSAPLLGVELGGTKLQLALGDGGGELARVWRARIDPAAGAPGVLASVERGLNELATEVRAVGVGFGGPVDDAGRVLTSHQVGGWAGFALADWFAERLRAPCAVGNDADVAGLGEAALGAGRGFDPCFYVTAGSGVGGGLIIGGDIFRGAGRGAGELGHLVVSVGGERGTVESFASGWAVARRAGCASGEEAVDRASAGSESARRAIGDAVEALAQGLAAVVALVCPRRIVLGGGVSLMPAHLVLNPLRTRLAELAFAPFAGLTEVVPAALGEAAVPAGAIELARRAARSAEAWE